MRIINRKVEIGEQCHPIELFIELSVQPIYLFSISIIETSKVLPLGNAPSRSEDDRFTVCPTSLVVYERIQKECAAYATHSKQLK